MRERVVKKRIVDAMENFMMVCLEELLEDLLEERRGWMGREERKKGKKEGKERKWRSLNRNVQTPCASICFPTSPCFEHQENLLSNLFKERVSTLEK